MAYRWFAWYAIVDLGYLGLWKVGAPEIISANIQPHDQTSMEVLYVREPRRTSGARYQRVTTCQIAKVLSHCADTKSRMSYLIWERVHGNTKGSRQAKVAKFQFTLADLWEGFWGFKSRCRTWFSMTKGRFPSTIEHEATELCSVQVRHGLHAGPCTSWDLARNIQKWGPVSFPCGLRRVDEQYWHVWVLS